MQLREALAIIREHHFQTSRTFSIVGSFEVSHFAVFLQACLIRRCRGRAPRVVSYGFDQLEIALAETSTNRRDDPTLVFLSWEDIDPRLSWRGRGFGESIDHRLIDESGSRLQSRLDRWLDARGPAESYLAVAPEAWLPFVDSTPPTAVGMVAATAGLAFASIAQRFVARGGRVVRLPFQSLHYRNLLASGCPMDIDESAAAAQHFVDNVLERAPRRKALVVDADGTLWKGVVGEDGPDGISCADGGAGYPYWVFQNFLLRLKREGVLLALVTKNNPEDVLPIFEELAMPLRLGDFAVCRCNWDSKATNIEQVARALNIGTDGIVFVDDNPAEIAEVKARLPAVTVARTPSTASEWLSFLTMLQDRFSAWQLTEEDRLRTTASASVEARVPAKPPESTGATWSHLAELDLAISVSDSGFHQPRTLELINKTNQFNLTGVRWGSDEWAAMVRDPLAHCFVARLKDRYGDFGVIGAVVVRSESQVSQMVLSCRAFGRGVEFALLAEAIRSLNVEQLEGHFVDTGRNAPARAFLSAIGARWIDASTWAVDRRVCDVSAAMLREGRVELAGDISA
jgi:FkbH-like protein